jgi:hypothetical protein
MSGGSDDDAVLAIARRGEDGRIVVVCVVNQGPPPPFDPRVAVARFADVLREYQISRVHGDAYGGQTFRQDFERVGIAYAMLTRTASQSYEAFEPLLNGHQVVLPDVPLLEQQLLGLVWRGGKITHPGGEHDDWSNAATAAVVLVADGAGTGPLSWVAGEFLATQTAEEVQRKEEQRAAEARAASAAFVRERVRRYGAYFPGD